ncbi:uncharacterized protein LOC130796896 [Amaranthus tricolor]|uniref:uncharacterized protein LOC130796896 n=1 Tax=Amaranthus tricolor TaxID=29722 RepID=UPI00258C2BF2|nr:uncharacterized protein LOC130796896 [Amaranthus tricolor]
MLRQIITGMLITMDRRELIQVFPTVMRIWWKNCQLTLLILLSLSLQIALLFLGKLRKYNGKPFLRFAVWSVYLLADWVPTVALGVISNRVQDHPENIAPLEEDLMSFWAPFLLLHLGGPDTITAYSFEDNQLWQRRLLELVVQLAVTIYIVLMALPGTSYISVLSFPMLIAGLIKFLERIYSLRSASTEQFRLSLIKEADPGPNYSKFMEEFTMKKAEGFYVKAEELIEAPPPTCGTMPVEKRELVLKAYDLFQTFKCLFVDLILSFQDRDESQCLFHKLEMEQAFEVIEIELGFAYDMFYTKTPAVYNLKGHILRFITFSLTLLSLVVFILKSRKDHYQKVDLCITYLLLVVAIILEGCSFLILVFSDWSDYWLKKHYKNNIVLDLMAPRRRRTNLISQYSIRKFCRKEKSVVFPRFLKLLMPENKVDEIWHLDNTSLSAKLKEMIFNHFLDISKLGNKSDLTILCSSRGKKWLINNSCSDLIWSISEVEFDQSILLWHIATDLCYLTEDAENYSLDHRTESRHMSEYMLYLLVMCPSMLPMGIGMIRFRDTCAEVWEFFKERSLDEVEASKMLLRVNTEIQPGKVKGDRSKSVLFDACRIATELRSKYSKQKWSIISGVWVEILAYAACHCRGTEHATQLRKGGEFLTHVWFLMAHLGITEQFQISQGHARAKLSAK